MGSLHFSLRLDGRRCLCPHWRSLRRLDGELRLNPCLAVTVFLPPLPSCAVGRGHGRPRNATLFRNQRHRAVRRQAPSAPPHLYCQDRPSEGKPGLGPPHGSNRCCPSPSPPRRHGFKRRPLTRGHLLKIHGLITSHLECLQYK